LPLFAIANQPFLQTVGPGRSYQAALLLLQTTQLAKSGVLTSLRRLFAYFVVEMLRFKNAVETDDLAYGMLRQPSQAGMLFQVLVTNGDKIPPAND